LQDLYKFNFNEAVNSNFNLAESQIKKLTWIKARAQPAVELACKAHNSGPHIWRHSNNGNTAFSRFGVNYKTRTYRTFKN